MRFENTDLKRRKCVASLAELLADDAKSILVLRRTTMVRNVHATAIIDQERSRSLQTVLTFLNRYCVLFHSILLFLKILSLPCRSSKFTPLARVQWPRDGLNWRNKIVWLYCQNAAITGTKNLFRGVAQQKPLDSTPPNRSHRYQIYA